MQKKSGFSLIELLVVVVIIGVLGAVGLVGYQAYIEQSRDATTKDNFEFLKRTLDQDIVSVENDLNSRSKFAETLTAKSKCYVLRDRYISSINLERNNPFNESQGLICDGNHFASYANGGAVDNASLKIARGRTMVYCDGIDFENASYKLVSGDLGMKFCTCTGQKECPTTKRFQGSIDNVSIFGLGATSMTVSFAYAHDNVTWARMRGNDALIGNQVGKVTQISGTTSPITLVVSGLKTEPASGDGVFEINKNVCFTPFGAANLATYRTTSLGGEGLYSTLTDNLTEISERHRCY